MNVIHEYFTIRSTTASKWWRHSRIGEEAIWRELHENCILCVQRRYSSWPQQLYINRMQWKNGCSLAPINCSCVSNKQTSQRQAEYGPACPDPRSAAPRSVASPRLNYIILAGKVSEINKCIGHDTKAAARQSLYCIKNKKKNKKYVLSNSESVQCNFFVFDHVTFIQFKICWPQLPVKFHVNLIHRSEDIAIWIFRIFGLKCLFRRVSKMGVLGEFGPLNVIIHPWDPQKAHPCVNPRRLSYQLERSDL